MSEHRQPWRSLYPAPVRNFALAQELTLAGLLDDSAAAHSTRTALTFEGQTWTFRELKQHASACAHLLRAHGIRSGERVAIALPNRPEYVFALFGTILAGGIAVQVNHRYPKHEIERILDDCQPSVVVSTDATAQACNTGDPDFLGRVFVRVGQRSQPSESLPFNLIEDYLEQPDLGTRITPSDTAVLQYTGGTTGEAKGVVLTHHNLTANVQQRGAVTYDRLPLPPGAKTVNVLPMCHVYGLTAVTLTAIHFGMNQILLPQFDPHEVLEVIASERPFVFTGVPTMYTALMRTPGVADAGLDDVAVYNSAGAGFPVEQMDRFERLTGARIIEGFGISEASPSTHINPPFADRRIGSVGVPLPMTDVRIVDRDGSGIEPLPVGEVGEMLIRGPQVMHGYWNRPEQSAQALRDGWLVTGDLAHMDEDGFFFIDGRKKEMIITGGFNVYPAEIEQVLVRFPGVVETAVVGLHDPHHGETVCAFVVGEPDCDVNATDLEKHCREYLAGYKVPREYRFIDALPRTPVGKIAKNQLERR